MIQVRDTDFPDAKIYVPDVYEDDRGFFTETYSRDKYAALGMHDLWVQDSLSRSTRNVIRGMHYDMRMAKFVQVLVGKIYDVIVDVREASPTFKKWQGFELSADNHFQLYVPMGFAHGFIALAEDNLVHYKMTAHFDPAHERILSWKDASVGIRWPLVGEPRLSPKDAAAP
jgi:dTDP-4-dehydrorhamnose 3,5-epimerase